MTAAAYVQVEPGAMLFPAIFFEPTNKEVLQMELGRTKVNYPQSSLITVLLHFPHQNGRRAIVFAGQ